MPGQLHALLNALHRHYFAFSTWRKLHLDLIVHESQNLRARAETVFLHINNISRLQIAQEMRELLQFGELLWKGDDILPKPCHVTSGFLTPAEVAHVDLHVVQSYKHGLDNSSVLEEVAKLLTYRNIVQAKQRIHSIRCGPELYAHVLDMLGYSVPFFHTAATCTRVETSQSRPLSRNVVPAFVIHKDRCLLQTLQLVRRLETRMERWESTITHLTLEQHHITEYTTSFQHALQKQPPKGQVYLCCPYRHCRFRADGDSERNSRRSRRGLRNHIPDVASPVSTPVHHSATLAVKQFNPYTKYRPRSTIS